MTDTITDTITDTMATAGPAKRTGGFRLAVIANLVWINASEVWRYFAVVKPLLHETVPGRPGIAAVTPGIFASWMLWDTILVLAATGFYWLYLERFGRTWRHGLAAALWFTAAVFGLLWLGTVNMGLVPVVFLWTALPLAWAEQAVAALIVLWTMRLRGR